jgi:hypothetical protein
MSALASWLLTIAVLGAVALFVLAVDRYLEHWWNTRDKRAAMQRHPSVMRSYCPSCGDRNVIHMGMHARLCHAMPAEDRPDWGQQ